MKHQLHVLTTKHVKEFITLRHKKKPLIMTPNQAYQCNVQVKSHNPIQSCKPTKGS